MSQSSWTDFNHEERLGDDSIGGFIESKCQLGPLVSDRGAYDLHPSVFVASNPVVILNGEASPCFS